MSEPMKGIKKKKDLQKSRDVGPKVKTTEIRNTEKDKIRPKQTHFPVFGNYR